jgi:DNA polymerase-3 subunit alpha
VPVPAGEWKKADLLAFEREMLGLYVSDHPLFGIEHVISGAADVAIGELAGDGTGPEDSWVTVAGIVSSVIRKITKAGAPWAQAVVEDLSGSIEVLFFPKTYEKHSMQLAEDAIVAVRGRVDARDDSLKLVAQELLLPDLSIAAPTGPVQIKLETYRCTPPLVNRLRDILAAHPGGTEVHLELSSTDPGKAPRSVCLELRVERSAALMSDLKALLGAGSVAA